MRWEVSPQIEALANKQLISRSEAALSPGYSTPGCHSIFPTMMEDTQVPSIGAEAICASVVKARNVRLERLSNPAGGTISRPPPRRRPEGFCETRSSEALQQSFSSSGGLDSGGGVVLGSVLTGSLEMVVCDADAEPPPPSPPAPPPEERSTR